MTYKQFMNKLEWDTSLVEIDKYIKGEKRLPDNLKKYHEQIEKDLYKIRQERVRENTEFYNDLVSSKLINLAFCKLGYSQYRDRLNENKAQETFGRCIEIMTDIVDRVNYSDGNGGVNTRAMLNEYLEKD